MLLDTLDEFRSAQELHDELRRRGENIGPTPADPFIGAVRNTITTIWCAATADRRSRWATMRSRRGPQRWRPDTALPMSATPSRSSAPARTVAAKSTGQRPTDLGALVEHHQNQCAQRVVAQAAARKVVAQQHVAGFARVAFGGTVAGLLHQRHRPEQCAVRLFGHLVTNLLGQQKIPSQNLRQ